MKIRVLHVIDHLGYGGAPFVVKSLVEQMPTDQVQSYVCALRPNPRPLPVDATVITLRSRKYSFAAMRSVPRLCEQHRIDVVHAHLQKAFIIALLARPRFTARLVLHEHGPIFRGGSGCIYRWVLKRFGSRADAIIANSEAASFAVKQAMSDPYLPVVVVPNSVDLERFDPDRYDRRTARASLGLTDEQFVVGFVGRLDRAKGPDLLVEAAARLPRDERAWCVYMVGDGPEKASLAKRIRQLGLERTVILSGLHENTAEVMRAFDVAVVPSRREAFGIAALESMRMRVPVIASPVGGLPELIENGETGVVLSRLDVDTIAEAIRRLASDETLRDRLVRKAFEQAGCFDAGNAAQQILGVYQRLACGT